MHTTSPGLAGPGRPQPFGVSVDALGGTNFALYADNALSVSLLLFDGTDSGEFLRFALGTENRTGSVWHCRVEGDLSGFSYCYELKGFEDDSAHQVADPYAHSLIGNRVWGSPGDHGAYVRSMIDAREFDWTGDVKPAVPDNELVIYELHVRGFTQDPSSATDHPGSYLGLIEKIPYLKDLGVNAVELLPVFEFDELDIERVDPVTGESLRNFWGYQPLGFFTPKQAYARNDARWEFKSLVKALHAEGIEVILDVVYNHTGEGEPGDGRFHSLKRLADRSYYLHTEDGNYANYSGCGNSLNTNCWPTTELIMASLRHWVSEYHVDGFRFDLASILTRGPDGAVMGSGSVVDLITHDPLLRDTRMIAEPWDAAGLYQLGQFGVGGRWYEWNGRYRDDIRDYVRSLPGSLSGLAARLTGSADLFPSPRNSAHSINFVTCHDGFSLRDLVSFNDKHNLRNGEQNRDGESHNRSWNCGEEGETSDPSINRLRHRQVRNFLTILLLSRGTPMLTAGDERFRTQGGNNNTYCQDNRLSWIDWSDAEQDASLFRFVRDLIAFRIANPMLNPLWAEEADSQVSYTWHGYCLNQAHWTEDSKWLGLLIQGKIDGVDQRSIYLMFNNDSATQTFELPGLSAGRWSLVADTREMDTRLSQSETRLSDSDHYDVAGHAVVVLVENAEPTGPA